MKIADIVRHSAVIGILFASGIILIRNPSITNRGAPLTAPEIKGSVDIGWFLVILAILWLAIILVPDKQWEKFTEWLKKFARSYI